MKCRDCEHRGWGYDEDTPVWGVCWKRGSCPDPDIERNCPDFSPKRPSLLEQLQSENERLRAELERMKRIMRDNGIMTIPSKYPGGPAEWNIPKPRGQKED